MRFNRTLAALVIVAMGATTAACSNNEPTRPTPNPSPQAVTEPGTLFTLSDDGVRRVKFLLGLGLTVTGYDRLIDDAAGALGEPIRTVTEKKQSTLPPGATVHDWVTWARYYWPVPGNPNAPYEKHDGKPISDQDQTPDYANFKTFTKNMRVLGLAYKLTGKKVYAQKAADMARAWFLNPATRMNPNVNFGQTIRNSSAQPHGAIEMYNLPMVIDGLTLIADAGVLSAADKDALKQWFFQYMNWLLKVPNGQYEGTFTNNRLAWYYAQIIAVATYVGDPGTALFYAGRAERVVEDQIAGDGSLPLEGGRANQQAYNSYALLALLRLAWAAGNVAGAPKLLDYVGADGSSVRMAVMAAANQAGGPDHPAAMRMGAYVYDDNASLAQIAFGNEHNTDSATVVGFPMNIGE